MKRLRETAKTALHVLSEEVGAAINSSGDEQTLQLRSCLTKAWALSTQAICEQDVADVTRQQISKILRILVSKCHFSADEAAAFFRRSLMPNALGIGTNSENEWIRAYAADFSNFLQTSKDSIVALTQDILLVASKLIELSEADAYPMGVGLGMRVCSFAGRNNFLRIVGFTLPVLRCSSSEASLLLRVLASLGLSIGDRWRWFVAISPQQLDLTAEDALALWNSLFISDWDTSGVEIVGVASRILIGAPAGVRVLLLQNFPVPFVPRFMLCREGELFLHQVDSPEIRFACQKWTIVNGSPSSVSKYFDAKELEEAMRTHDLTCERKLALCEAFVVLGASVPFRVTSDVVACLKNSLPPSAPLALVRLILSYDSKDDVVALFNLLPFRPQFIPICLKWGINRPSLWTDDVDALFLEPDVSVTCSVLYLTARFSEASSILVAFARSKRSVSSEVFVALLECIGSLKYSSNVLGAITSSAGRDPRGAALTLWYNATEKLWDSMLVAGLRDPSESSAWALAAAARLHETSVDELGGSMCAETTRLVFGAIRKLRRPLTICAVTNIIQLAQRYDVRDAFEALVGEGETPKSVLSSCSPDESILCEIVSSLIEAKQPSQGFGLQSTADRIGIELEKIPQLLARIRPQLVLHVLFQEFYSDELMSLSLSLSFCAGEPRQWPQQVKKMTSQVRMTVHKLALEVLDRLGERLSKVKQSRIRDALAFRAMRNLVLFLGKDIQPVTSKILAVLFSKRGSSSLHVVLLEVVYALVETVDSDFWSSRGDSLVADCLDLVPMMCNPESFRYWVRVVKLLHSKSTKSPFWKPVFNDATLPASILSTFAFEPCSLRTFLSTCVELLGSTSHTFRRILLGSLIAKIRKDASCLTYLSANADLVVSNVLECVQVPLLSELAAELLGVVGNLACARAKVATSRSIEDLLSQSLDWRKFILATLGTHCPSAMDAVASADAHDQIAFAVQEVIRAGSEEERKVHARVGPLSRSELEAYPWWSQLPSKLRDRYQVFLSSNYSIPKTSAPPSLDQVFEPSMPVSTWCRQFSRALAFHAKEPFQQFFKATRALAVADRSRMFELLPLFALHNALQVSGTLDFIAKEINASCAGGSREHVMISLSLVDTLQRAADRIILSDKISKFKIKEIEEFPYGGRVQTVLNQLDVATIVSAAVSFGFDSHAVRLLESSRRLPRPANLETSVVVSLKKAFRNLHDPHSVRAVRELAPPQVATVEDLELENDFDGAVRFALECISDVGVQNAPPSLLLSFARSAEMAGRPSTSVSVLEKVEPRSEELQHHLNEASWRLGRWDEVREVPSPGLFEPVRALVLDKPVAVKKQIAAVSSILSTMASHTDSIPDRYLVFLTSLEDIRFVEESRDKIDVVKAYLSRRMRQAWGFRNPEPLRCLYSILLRIIGARDELGELWVGNARHALQMEDYESAISSARRVGSLGLKDDYHSEIATILFKMGRKTEAIQFALHSIDNVSPECASRLKARSALWGHELNFHTTSHTASLLADAVRQHGSHESFEMLGLFHYQMFSNARSATEGSSGSQAIKDIYKAMEGHALPGMVAFSKAVTLNQKHIMEAIPRLVTMWLDGNSTLYQLLKEGRLRGYDPERITADTSAVATRLSPSLYLSSVGHLLSRLATNETSTAVASVLVKLIQAHPQPLLWQVLAAALSNPASRASTIQSKVLAPFVDSGGKDSLSHFKSLFSCLTQICRGTIAGNKLSSFEPVRKLTPLLAVAKFTLPSIRSLHPSYSGDTSSFYFDASPYIQSFGDQVDVINSLQKPKRIVMIDSAGGSHFYLMKAKDDPRKDIRMMEIATHINNVFIKGSSRVTDALSLQCYAVMALCDDCALIEWVDGTATIRRILDETYAIDGTGVKISEVQAWKEACDKGKFSKNDLFTKYIFPAAPPVLHQWFQRSFTHTLHWYRARSLYTQSCAVWSMCGHIVGLGDRHAENLLISLNSGQAMHVDFACMFDKGETLRVPETVRFRLTPNVVDGFGITATHGPFTNCCEQALAVLSDNKDIVEGVLETFIYDPLLEWSSKDGKTDPKALIRRCKRRLDGYTDFYGAPKDEVPLSVSGQVRALINHNSKLDVLSEMYIWWMVWL